jgi:hypothetical protein
MTNMRLSSTRATGCRESSRILAAGWLGLALLCGAPRSAAQMSPAEVRNPQLRKLETTYLPQLKELRQIIASTRFPFSFVLSKYVGLDPKQQAETDTRGIEFVHFREKVVLKITGNYNAAYNADQLTDNQRAAHVFNNVIVPILSGVSRTIPADVECDGIGFEISYHVRRETKAYDYEGKEILVVVLKPADAFVMEQASSETARQEILNRSDVYVDGKEFGLALGARDPLDTEELQRSEMEPPATPHVAAPAAAGDNTRLPRKNLRLLPAEAQNTAPVAPGTPATHVFGSMPGTDEARGTAAEESSNTASTAAAEQLQARYQQELNALAVTGQAKFHFVDYAPPSFTVFQNRIVLQVTLRNAARYDPESTSIYKRAARTFDLFLAPQLKDILDKAPGGDSFDGLDISVLQVLQSSSASSSEAVEFICPLRPLRQFTQAEITNQQLIDQSVVLVNGVRIALDLQKVE